MSSSAVCFWPNGKQVTQYNYQPCNAGADPAHAACCDLRTSVCTENGYCIGNANYVYRGGCTDSTWSSSSCAQKCSFAGTYVERCYSLLGLLSPGPLLVSQCSFHLHSIAHVPPFNEFINRRVEVISKQSRRISPTSPTSSTVEPARGFRPTTKNGAVAGPTDRAAARTSSRWPLAGHIRRRTRRASLPPPPPPQPSPSPRTPAPTHRRGPTRQRPIQI